MVGSKSNAAASVPQGLIEAILGAASDAIIASDADGRITFGTPGRPGYSALPQRRLSGAPSI